MSRKTHPHVEGRILALAHLKYSRFMIQRVEYCCFGIYYIESVEKGSKIDQEKIWEAVRTEETEVSENWETQCHQKD